MANKPTTFSMRMPADLNEKIQTYAAEHSCTKAEAMSHFARAGIALEENGGTAPEGQATTASMTDAASTDALTKIQERLEALQNLPTIEPSPTSAIVPIDIRDKIQAYSAAHDCSEHEALTYYARIGIQVTDDDRPASASEVAELARRLDALAADGSQKNEQLKQMTELLTSIRDYTKPDELELEGELAEDVEDVELTDEDRQRIADEHTRQIVSDVMGDYLERQNQQEREREAAAQAAQAQQQSAQSPMAMWVPVLVAIIVSLVMGLVVILTR